ncbi:MAG TPA: trypsin-like peptidase domain-containing protein [Phycisphaeraceae bacterium]
MPMPPMRLFHRHPGLRRRRMGRIVAAGVLIAAQASLSLAAEPAQGAQPDPRRVTPVVQVFQAARDAVVNISSTQIVEVQSPFGGMGGGFDELFQEFFDLPQFGPRRRIERTSVGSGFVIHPAGYIVTNAHVVARTAERKAIFADGSEYDAQVVAIDAEHDLAVLKIEADHPLKTLPLGTSSDLMVGETVIAIGNPLGYQHTVTAGVVSALDRSLPISPQTQFRGLIQTDASINPGNSGGPLLNVLGELVGINTAIRADAQNIGFAIPVDQLRRLLPEMLDVERRYRIRTGLRVEGDGGRCRVAQVEPNSPAAQAGIAPGQVIEAIDGVPVRSVIDFHIALIGRQPGDTLRLTMASGAVRNLTLAARPRPDGAKLLRAKFGIEAEAITPELARRLGVPRLRGLIITGVELASPADRIGLREGDILSQVGRHQPRSLQELGDLLEGVASGQTVELGVLRVRGNALYLTLVPIQAR